MGRKQERLHLLLGLKQILLDIDKAIRIIRETESESEVVPNLMNGFSIDQIQAEYVAEIKLRNINKAYIINRVEETSALEKEIADLKDTLDKPKRVKKLIISELERIKKKYSLPRKTLVVYDAEGEEETEAEEIGDYPVHLFLSKDGYFKKITPLSLRLGGEQKWKPGDGLLCQMEATNRAECLLITNHQHAYKIRAYEFEDMKASLLGEYLPAKLDMEEGEKILSKRPPPKLPVTPKK